MAVRGGHSHETVNYRLVTVEQGNLESVVSATGPLDAVTTVQKRLAGRQFIAQILGPAWSPDDVPAAMEEATAITHESHDLADWEEDDFDLCNRRHRYTRA